MTFRDIFSPQAWGWDKKKKKWTYHGEVLPFFFTEKWVPDFNQSLLQRTEAEVRLSQFQGVLSKQPKTLPWPFPVWFHITTVTVTSLLHILTCSQASNQNILSTLVWSSALCQRSVRHSRHTRAHRELYKLFERDSSLRYSV